MTTFFFKWEKRWKAPSIFVEKNRTKLRRMYQATVKPRRMYQATVKPRRMYQATVKPKRIQGRSQNVQCIAKDTLRQRLYHQTDKLQDVQCQVSLTIGLNA